MSLPGCTYRYGRVYGTAPLCEQALEGDTVAWRDQQWFLGQTKEGGVTYISSLFYGVFLGAHAGPGPSTEKLVRVAPAHANSAEAHWSIQLRDGSEVVEVIWKGNNEGSLYGLDIQGGQPICSASIPSSAQPLWRLIPDPVQRCTTVTPAWLGKVPSPTPLILLNLPATHQSLALHGLRLPAFSPTHPGYNYPLVDNPRCQNRPPLEQLYDGIRVLDLRFTVSLSPTGPVLVAQHGPAKMGYTLLAVLLTAHHFLALYPTEMVILSIRNESNLDPPAFAQAIRSDLASLPSESFVHPVKQSMREIQLSDVRGKIVILGYQANLPSEYASTLTFFGPPNSWMTELKWNYFPFNYPTKVANAARVMQHARLSRLKDPKRAGYVVAWNQSILGIINPIDAVKRLKPFIQAQYAVEKCGTGGEYRFGLVYLDFYEHFAEQVDNIVKSNIGLGDQ